MANTSDQNEMKESRYADVVELATTVGVSAQLSIAKVVSTDNRARAWRVTLASIRRQDGSAILVSGGAGQASAIFPPATRQYESGQDNTPQVPPRRANPIFGLANPTNGADIEPLFVQIVWGMTAGTQCSLIANWPMQGASIVVEGSYVEVFAGAAVFSVGESPGDSSGLPPIGGAVPLGSFPRFAAHVTPADGLASESAGELSITQNRPMGAFVGAGTVAGILTDGIAHPTNGFLIESGPVASPPQGAMVGSTVYNVAPFVSWNAELAFLQFNNTISRLLINTSNVGGPVFALSDNAEPDGSGGFGQSPGNVAINYFTDGATGVKTIADLEALIGTSQLIQVITPDAANAAKKLFAGFTVAPTHVPGAPGVSLASAITVGATQGCAVYVPNFARRLRVEVARLERAFLGNEYRVPIAGPLPIQIVWYDDAGRVVYTEFQGRTLSADTSGLDGTTEPNCWRPVPAQAVMVAIYGGTADGNDQAFFHWRLTP